MPFTGSHPAAVLPLMRLGLVPSALVIGSMVPDLPYYLPMPVHSALTHSARGVVGIDLVLGLIAFAVWQVVLAPVAVAASAPSLRHRLAPELPVDWRRHTAGVRAVALVVLSLLIGAATHVLWDEFTHIDHWGYRHLAWLSAVHGPLAGYRWAQYGSGLVGGAMIVFAVWRWWRDTPMADPAVHPQRVQALARTTSIMVWTAIALAALGGAVTGFCAAMFRDEGLRRALFLTATWGGGAGLVLALVCASACLTQLRRQSR